MDIWYVFVCKALELLVPNGILNFIATNNWTTADGASKLRNYIVNNAKINQIVDFGSFMVFDSASIQTMIMQFTKNNIADNYSFDYRKLEGNATLEDIFDVFHKNQNEKATYLQPTVLREKFKDKFLTFSSDANNTLLSKIAAKGIYLTENEIAQGIVPNPDVINSKNIKQISQDKINNYSIKVNDGVFIIGKNKFNYLPKEEQKYIKPLFEPTEIEKYIVKDTNTRILYITKQNYSADAPHLIEHLEKYREIMDQRRENQNGKLDFFHLHWSRDAFYFEAGYKILSVRKCSVPTFAYTEKEAYVMMAVNVIKTNRFNHKYLTGLLNSKLIAFWLKNKGKMQGDNYQLDKEPLLQIPIYQPTDEQQQLLISLVEQIFSAKKEDTAADTTELEQKIDALVFHLYGLTESEMLTVLLSQEVRETDRRRIQAFYKDYEKIFTKK
jgi:adenine-specific DNA-methyltransferase